MYGENSRIEFYYSRTKYLKQHWINRPIHMKSIITQSTYPSHSLSRYASIALPIAHQSSLSYRGIAPGRHLARVLRLSAGARWLVRRQELYCAENKGLGALEHFPVLYVCVVGGQDVLELSI